MNPSSQLRRYPSRRAVLGAAVAGAALPMLGGCVTGGDDDDHRGRRRARRPAREPARRARQDRRSRSSSSRAATATSTRSTPSRSTSSSYPGATVDHKGIQKVGEALQPRFVADTPPDVVDNTGAGRLDLATLVGAGKLTDLTELLDAPSLDDPAKKVRDTLLPGVIDDGTFDGKAQTLNFTYTVWGLWYSKPLFAKNGWTFPTTWDEMLTLCEQIKKAGIAPWTYQGKYPEYLNDPLLAMAAKAGGLDLVKAIDNLEPNAWKQPALVDAADRDRRAGRQGLHPVRQRGAVAHRGAGRVVAEPGRVHPLWIVAGGASRRASRRPASTW